MKDTLLIFDLDGTLWDSAGPVAEAWNEVFQRECPGLPLLTKEDIHSVMGMTMKEIGQTLYADISIPRRDEIFDICCVYEVEYLHSHCGTRKDMTWPLSVTASGAMWMRSLPPPAPPICLLTMRNGSAPASPKEKTSVWSWIATTTAKGSISAIPARTRKQPSRQGFPSSTPPTASVKLKIPMVSSTPYPNSHL